MEVVLGLPSMWVEFDLGLAMLGSNQPMQLSEEITI
jgi:hypothetical protein